MRCLVVTAVEAEAVAVGEHPETLVLAGGVGRTNAAVSTTMAMLEHGPFDVILNVGIAGILPGNDLNIGDVVIADRCIYMEEGIQTPEGFLTTESMGFPLGDFTGNEVPVGKGLVERCPDQYRRGPIATVATCSGTNEQAEKVHERTGALAEAMEGAAVVHAALRLGTPGLEVRSMSNFTGHRANQQWDIQSALKPLHGVVNDLIVSFKQ